MELYAWTQGYTFFYKQLDFSFQPGVAYGFFRNEPKTKEDVQEVSGGIRVKIPLLDVVVASRGRRGFSTPWLLEVVASRLYGFSTPLWLLEVVVASRRHGKSSSWFLVFERGPN